MKLSDYLSKERGNAAMLAKSIGSHAPDVSRWAKDEGDKDFRPVPLSKCISIERATNGEVSRKDLRPNDWQDIWPELVGADDERPLQVGLHSEHDDSRGNDSRRL